MPPWVASAPRPTTLCSRRAIDTFTNASRCRYARNQTSPLLRFRAASTHVSPTAINYRPNIPSRNKELYDALSYLSAKAEQYVNISRLQLALRGLAVENAVTRVAVLGVSSQSGARRFARALLADPLAGEEGWEAELKKGSEQGAVLIRFGDETDVHPSSPLYKIISVPSRTLESHRLEILVSTLNVNVAQLGHSPADSSMDAVLVPKLLATSASGIPVPYPVHKTLVLGEGLDSAVAYGKFTVDDTEVTGMVKVAIDLPPPAKEVEVNDRAMATPVNIDSATQALSALRSSVQNATFYERNWFASNLPAISKWLTQDLQGASTNMSMKPAHIALISSILNDIEASITRADVQHAALLTATASVAADRLPAEMTSYVEEWAERAHEELRDSLDDAIVSKSWRRLAWWKLFLRVDDVGMVLEEVLQRRWLVNAERDATFLAGRMKQAGFAEVIPQTPIVVVEPEETPLPTTEQHDTTTSLPPPSPSQSTTNALSTEVKEPTPWPTLLPTTRAYLLTTSAPPLHALAQHLILTTLSTTSLSSALSALLYVSVESFSVFEAGAIAALGAVFSLRRMQRVWEGARDAWIERIREEGRWAVKGVQGDVQRIAQGGGKVGGVDGVDVDSGVAERRGAREAVARVREILGRSV